MPTDVVWSQLLDALSALMIYVPGETLNDKTGLLANIFGMAGFVLSVSIVVGRLVTQRGKRRPATLADLDHLGASLVATLQDRIVDQLAAEPNARLANAAWLEPEQRSEAQNELRHGVAAAVRSIASDDTEAGRSAASALIKGDLAPVEEFFEARALSRDAGEGDASRAAEALHMKAALQSLHDPARAVEACLRAVRRNPSDPLGWSRLGHLYLRIGNLPEAKEAFLKAISV
ncbi:MAG: hypothetical protein KDJ36_02040 [Hyphomicrobiaceae bacterium]|nr:hypothetical protein [Hyphomicrobiaceae bacterium]